MFRNPLASILSELLNGLAELLPNVGGIGLGSRLAPPITGSRLRARRRVGVSAVRLPLTSPVYRFKISLPPTALIQVAAATRPDEPHIYAHLEAADHASLVPPAERAAALASGYLLEVPRRVLRWDFVVA